MKKQLLPVHLFIWAVLTETRCGKHYGRQWDLKGTRSGSPCGKARRLGRGSVSPRQWEKEESRWRAFLFCGPATFSPYSPTHPEWLWWRVQIRSLSDRKTGWVNQMTKNPSSPGFITWPFWASVLSALKWELTPAFFPGMLQDTQERMAMADTAYCAISHLVAQIFSNTYHVHYNC